MTSENWASGPHDCTSVVKSTDNGASAALAVLAGIWTAKLRQFVPPIRMTSAGITALVTALLNTLHHASVPSASPGTGHFGNADGNSFTGTMPSAVSPYSKHLLGLQSMPQPVLEYRA